MSEDWWHPISEDGKRMITRHLSGYNLHECHVPIDAQAATRIFEWCAFVPTFELAEQFLKSGSVRGQSIEVAVMPKAKRAHGAAA